jgi:Xaa-Pro aminopeptidase
VLKGHIALARARFPVGTSGAQLDTLARQFLWSEGFDYDHGTGHGVGSYLSVHEGPQNISRRGAAELRPGMVVSDEPGYYKAGCYGIRCENLLLVQELPTPVGSTMRQLGFETLTLVPFDRRLVDVSLLDHAEIAWLDHYHARVLQVVSPLLDRDDAIWLKRAAAPLKPPRAPRRAQAKSA